MFLEVKNLTKSFGETKVLQGIDFGLEKGQVLSIIGSSGSGKTTLLRCINALETADGGEIYVGGNKIFDAAEANLKKKKTNIVNFGFVFQSFNLFPQYTALENVTLAPFLQIKKQCKANKVPKAERDRLLAEAKTLEQRCKNMLPEADRKKLLAEAKELRLQSKDGLSKVEREKLLSKLNAIRQQCKDTKLPKAERKSLLANAKEIRQQFKSKPSKYVRERLLAEAKINALTLLDKVGLSDKSNFYPCQLSGGQQQRVSIARALALNPDVLCFDEPTSALDPEITGEVLKIIKELAAENMTMIIVTHEMAFARDVSDKIIFMDNGVIAASGSPAQIFTSTSNHRLQSFLHSFYENT